MTRKKYFHPEGIPWPFTCIYNLVSMSSIFRDHYSLVADEISGLCKTGSVLDIGTGPARLLLAIKRVSPQLELAGIDISAGMVRQGEANIRRAGFAGEIAVKQGASDSIPFPNRSFDVVVSTGSIHHWREPELSIREICRVLKPGGAACLYDIVRNMPGDVITGLKRDYGRFRMAMLWLHSFEEPFYDMDEFRTLSGLSGMQTVDLHFTGALCALYLKKG